MSRDSFRAFLKRGGRSPSAVDRCLSCVQDLEQYLALQPEGRSVDEAQPEDLEGFVASCDIRVCALGRGATNCAHCQDYGCEKVEEFFGFVPDARATLDGIRAELLA